MTGVVRSVPNMLARAGPILARLPAGKAVMVEIGVSTALLSEHLLNTKRDLEWYGIDPWLGMEDCSAAYKATLDLHSRLPLDRVEKHMRLALSRVAPFGKRAEVHRAMSVDAAPLFADASLDCVFCDADHSVEGTSEDIETWWPKVKPGGVLGGHDINHTDPRFRFGVTEAVNVWVAETGNEVVLDTGGTWWARKP